MSEVRELLADDWIIIKGHGILATFPKEEMPEDLWDPVQMRDEEYVLINGYPCKVRNAETYCVLKGPEYPYRDNFGLLIDFCSPWKRVYAARGGNR